MASWLVRSSLDQAVQVRALTGDILLCSWARHFVNSHSASLHPGTVNLMLGSGPVMDLYPIQGRVEICLVSSCY